MPAKRSACGSVKPLVATLALVGLLLGLAACRGFFGQGPIALLNVILPAEDEEAPVGPDGSQRDLDRDLPSVLPDRVEVAAGPNGPGLRRGEELLTVLDVLFPETCRDKDLDGLPEEFVPVVREELLRLGVDQDDLPRLVHDDQGRRGGLHDQAETLLRVPWR